MFEIVYIYKSTEHHVVFLNKNLCFIKAQTNGYELVQEESLLLLFMQFIVNNNVEILVIEKIPRFNAINKTMKGVERALKYNMFQS